MATVITVVSHNVRGYSNNKGYIQRRCKDENMVLAIQEHWLRPNHKAHVGVNTLRSTHKDYEGYGTSGMDVEAKIVRGRPYGGTGWLWPKKLLSCIKPRFEYQHKRVTVMELNCDKNILLINVYFPFYSVSNFANQEREYCDTIGFIDFVVSENLDKSVLIATDMNCDIHNDSHPFSKLLLPAIKSWKLVPCFELMDNFDSKTEWTRTDGKNSFSLIDCIFVSEDITSLVSNVRIVHDGDNLSDHSPIQLDLNISFNSDGIEARDDGKLPFINWSKVPSRDLEGYRDLLKLELSSISIPSDSVLHGAENCDSFEHIFDIQRYFESIIRAIDVADKCLSRCFPKTQKDYWNSALSDLKQKSIEASDLWCSIGRPKHGPFYDSKIKAHLSYKKAVRDSCRSFASDPTEKLNHYLMHGNNNRFWKSWRRTQGKSTDVTLIDGVTGNGNIVNHFSEYFRSIYNDSETALCAKLKAQYHNAFSKYASDHCHDSLLPHYISWDELVTALTDLKPGKSAATFVKVEHILHGPPELMVHIHILFNAFIQHGYVCSEFLKGTIVPIVKDQSGDLFTVKNYRGVTLGSALSQLFEKCLLIKFGHCLSSDDLQFGYKRHHSTSHAMFALKTCVDHFLKRGSGVFVTFMDCSKGFDKVNHDALFTKLIQRNVPYCFIRLIVYWYSNLSSNCRWANAYSGYFSVPAGVRQGGILSPYFWAVYVDELISKLRKSGYGCYLSSLFLACIFYADDVALLSPTVTGMQTMIDICASYAKENGLSYNFKKTKTIFFGKPIRSIKHDSFFLNNGSIEIVSSWKYLGFFLSNAGHKFVFDPYEERKSFFRSSNCIINSLYKPSEEILMKLYFTNCVSIFTYGIEVKEYLVRDLTNIHISMNDGIQKIFGWNRWESVRHLRSSFGYKDIYTMITSRKRKFYQSIPQLRNSLLTSLVSFI